MMTFWTLFRRELGSFFVSPVAYVVLFACTVINGGTFAFWLFFFEQRNIRDATILNATMNGMLFWLMLIMIVPAITMRVFSEEFKLGTIEMLMTAPVREWAVVVAKYGAALAFFLIVWLPEVIDLAWLHFVNREINASWGMLTLPFLGLFLIGAFFVSIGVFTSVLTRNQIIAAILSFAGIFFFMFFIWLISYLDIGPGARKLIEYFSPIIHMDVFSKGIFDTRPVVWYGSGTLFFLFLTQRVLQTRRLRA